MERSLADDRDESVVTAITNLPREGKEEHMILCTKNKLL